MRRRARQRIRIVAGLVAALALGVGLWTQHARDVEQVQSAVITRPAPELTPTAQVLLPDLRDAVVVVPDRPHAPEEVQAPDRAQRIRRTRSFKVNTNHLGLRGPELQDPAPPYRILAVGDSITFGWGVADDLSWPAQLADALGVEVVNAGVPAQRPDAITAWTLANAPSLDVDLVIYCRRPDGREPDPPAHLAAAVQRLREGLGGTPVVLVLPPISTFDPYGVSHGDEEVARLRAALPDLPLLDLTPTFRAALPAPGVTLEIAGDRQRVIQQPGGRIALDVAAPQQGLAPEILDWFEEHRSLQEPYFFDGGHPDAQGFRLFARTLATWLRADGILPDDVRAPPPTTGPAPLIPANAPEWASEPPAFVNDPAFYGEASWDDVRGRVLQHQVISLRDRARLAAQTGDLQAAAARYAEAVAWVEAHPIQTGTGEALHGILLAGLQRDRALTEALAAGQPPPVPESGLARLRALLLGGASASALASEIKTLSFDDLNPSAFSDFQDRHALRIALVRAATDAADPLAFEDRWGPWDPASRPAIAAAILAAASGPATLPLHQRAAANLPRPEARFTAEGLGALPTGDTWVDTGGEPGPAAIGRLEALSLEDPQHRARLEAEAARLQAALTADPASVPAALRPLLDSLAGAPYTSRYYNIKAARNEAIRQLARAGASAVAAQIVLESFPLHAQDWACPNRAGILHGLRGRLLAVAGDPGADDALRLALEDGAAFWAQIDQAAQARR